MAFFQESVLKQQLSNLDDDLLVPSWEQFKSYFKSNSTQEKILQLKEEEFQGDFLFELFDKCLGYTKSLEGRNLFQELKNETDSKKADGAIKIDGDVVCVIELKSSKTKELSKIEDQAFGYLTAHPNCKYVVTSNFRKLRFYIQNKTEFEEFDLFNLSEERFRMLWLCLSFQSISSNLPLELKNRSLVNEEKVTKQLYSDYSSFRQDLFNDIVKHNPNYEKSLILNKTQKLLDRILFILFAEDRGILPVNAISEILNNWESRKEFGDDVTLYMSFITYFNNIYKGRNHKDPNKVIFSYNGGLFDPDDVLERLIISDDILLNYGKKLTAYDFESDISVNILGHIFEHSLSEIEELQNQIEGKKLDKSKSKRKKDGVFYTPQYITRYIVENTVGKLCEEKKNELKIVEEEYLKGRKGRPKNKLEILRDVLEDYRKWLLELTICDPACGSGAFLNQALEFLISEHNYIDELQNCLLGGGFKFPEIENSILENNLYGVDINKESVEIAKLSLWLRTAQKGRKLTSLNNNIKCGNSLIDDPEVAGEKAFNWQKEFPEVFDKGGFDVVIGNPPYVQNNEKKYITYYTFECGDLYSYFFEKGLEILSKKGIFSYITPNLFLKGMRYEKLRNYLLEHSRIIEVLDKGDNVFDGVQMPTAITTLSKEKINIQKWDEFLPDNNIVESVINNTIPLNDITKIKRGLELGKDKVLDYKSDIQFLTGENIFRYGIKEFSYIENTTYNKFKKDNYYFTGERILIRETGNRITSIFLNDIITQQNRSIYSIKIENYEINPLFILSILNSKTIQFFYQTKFASNTNIFPKIRIGQVKQLPIKIISLKNQTPFIEKTKSIISSIQKLQELSNKFQRTLQRRFDIDKLPKKLQDWYELNFENFIRELKKKKIKLSLSEESEWEDFFSQESKKTLEIKDSIDKTDKEIDQMVYELYGLTKEEIEIVENS